MVKLTEIISKEDLQKLFDDGYGYKEIAEKYNVSERQVKRLNQTHYHIKRDVKFITKQRKQTFTNKYGYDCARKVPEIQQSIEENYKAKYGVSNPSQNKEVQEKRKQVFIEKYGVDNPFANKDIQQKILNTYKEKYGVSVDNVSQIPELKTKISSAIRLAKADSKHRTEEQSNITSSKENFEKYIEGLSKSNRTIQYIANDLNYDDTTIGAYLKAYGLSDLIKYHDNSSTYEKDIMNMLKSNNIDCVKNRTVLENKQEIDIYVPGYNFGIEFNGNYWHCEINKNRSYHQIKSLDAESKGIFLYHIFEYEWEDERIKDIILSQLKLKCQIYDKKIYGRKCIIKELSKSEKKVFYNENHIQGNTSTTNDYGLFYNDELVAAMSFSNVRFTNNDKVELSRFCVKKNYIVIGGASKLFNYYIDINPDVEIISYSNITKTTGTMYETLGFKCEHITKPDYVWWKSHKPIMSRYQARQKNEIENMQNLGYSRIFDCGHKVWIYKK